MPCTEAYREHIMYTFNGYCKTVIRRVIKTRLTEEEYAEFSERVALCKMTQAEFIRQALTKSRIQPVITVSTVSDELIDAEDENSLELGPGAILDLAEGEKAHDINPGRPNKNFSGFVEAICRQIGTALEIPYEFSGEANDASDIYDKQIPQSSFPLYRGCNLNDSVSKCCFFLAVSSVNNCSTTASYIFH